MRTLKNRRAESRRLSHDVKLQASIIVDEARRLGYTCFFHAASRESIMFQIVMKKCIEYIGLRLRTAKKCLRANIQHQDEMPLMPSDYTREAKDGENVICMSPFLHSDKLGENPDDYLAGRLSNSWNTQNNLKRDAILESGMRQLNRMVLSKKDALLRLLPESLISDIKSIFIQFLRKKFIAGSYVLTVLFSDPACAGIRARVSAPFDCSDFGYEIFKDSGLHALNKLNELSQW